MSGNPFDQFDNAPAPSSAPDGQAMAYVPKQGGGYAVAPATHGGGFTLAPPTSAANPFDKFDPAPTNSSAHLDPLADITGAMSGAWNKLKTDYQTARTNESNRLDAAAKGNFGSPLNMLNPLANGGGDTLRMVGDVGALAASPVAGAVRGLAIHPAAAAAAYIPMPTQIGQSAPPSYDQREAIWEKGIGNALSALPAGRVAGAADAVAPVNALASAAPRNALADTVAQFDRAGVRPSLVAATGADTAPITKAIGENVFAGHAVRKNIAGQLGDVQTSAGNLANQYGTPLTPQGAGQTIKSGVQDFANGDAPNTFASKAGALYDDVFGKLDDAMAGKTTPRQTVPDRGVYYTGATKQVGGSQISTANTQAALGDVTGGAVQSKAIADLITDPQLKGIAQAVQKGTPDMNFNDLRQLRTFVRTAQKTNGPLRQSVGSANLQRLEGALTQDIYSNAANLGSPQLLHQLQRADQFYAAGQQRIASKLDPLAKAATPDEGAYGMIQRAASDQGGADLARITAVKRSLGSDWNDVAATMADRLGKATPGAANPAQESPFSVATFVKNYMAMSPAGRETVFGARGGGGAQASSLKAELDNLVGVAGKLKGVEAAANRSNSGVSVQNLGSAAALLHPATTVPTALTLGAGYLTGELMTNPAAVRLIARMAGPKAAAQSAAIDQGISALGRQDPKAAAQLQRLHQAVRLGGQVAGDTSQLSSPSATAPAGTPLQTVGAARP